MELLGNEQLNHRISGILQTGKISHCYLITGPEGSGKHTVADLFSAAILCTGSGKKPCGRCPQCRKVAEHIHPDVITVDDEEHKQLPIRLIKSTVADSFVMPNEGSRKIYVFPHAEKLSQQGQNTLLKLLEEPPSHAVFFLMIANATLLLPTVRSRCAELQLSPLGEAVIVQELARRKPGHSREEYLRAAGSGYLGQALLLLDNPPDRSEEKRFLDAFGDGGTLSCLELMTHLEKKGREELGTILQSWRRLLIEALKCKYSGSCDNPEAKKLMQMRGAKELLAASDALDGALRELDSNVNPAAVCAGLAVRLSSPPSRRN